MVQEVSFLNIVGQEVSLSNLVAQMIDYYNQKLSVGGTRITDFNEGSEIRNLLEAIAVMSYAILEDENEAGKLPFIKLSYGSYLDRIGENPFINLPRIQGKESEGSATFTLSTAQSDNITIAGGTVLKDSVIGLEFVTLDDLIIPSGETSGVVGVNCLTAGSDGNINSGTLTIIDDPNVNTDLITVNNLDEFINGSDYEDDEVYRQRLLDNVQSDGFGTSGYYLKLGNNVNGVHDTKLIDATGYTKKVLVNGYTKPTPDTVLLNVLAEFSDVSNIVMGHTFTVDKPTYETVNLTFTLDVLTEQTTTDLTNHVTAIVNGGDWDRMEFDGLNIGENLTKALLVEGLGYNAYITNVGVKVTGQSSEFDTTDISANEVVKLGTLTFNQTVVG